jgi:hypothetical protein
VTPRRPFAAAFLATLVSCSDASGPSGLAISNAGQLAAELEAIDQAVASPQLRSLSGLSIPINRGGIDVHNMTPSLLGRTLEWAPVLREVLFTSRTGAPADAIRLMLYTTDSTSRPAYPPVEIGYVDLYPYNAFNGGGPDSISLRFVVTDTRATPTVIADFLAHSHADAACQCAIVEGWASNGTTRVDFRSSYNIPQGGDGQFPGDFATPGVGFQHFATLPGPGVSTATANMALRFGGDSITATSGLLRPHAGQLNGETEVMINGEHFSTVTRTAAGITATAPGVRRLTSAEQRALGGLLAVLADIAYYIEWPTFVIFFCGC